MSQMSDSPYASRTRYLGPQSEIKKHCDPVERAIGVNGWRLSQDVDQYGKITMVARKDIGNLGSPLQNMASR